MTPFSVIQSFSGCPRDKLWKSTRQTSWSAISNCPRVKKSNQISVLGSRGMEKGGREENTGEINTMHRFLIGSNLLVINCLEMVAKGIKM